jgi:beta-glucosidase
MSFSSHVSEQHGPADLFPADFVWGAAAASYQIEGAAAIDGKGPSTWDRFCAMPGKVWLNQSGRVACDHYHRYAEDVRLMKQMGVMAYRLSLSWPRLIPQGTGSVNPRGFDFYERLVDALLEVGITPYITLFHWDYPLALYHRGGWLNKDSVGWFADYTESVAKRLGDRVKHWMTFNEPQVFIDAGHREGRHAPGDRLRFAEVLRACHHVLLSHGESVQALRALTSDSVIGFAPVALPAVPPPGEASDIPSLRAHMFRTTTKNLRTNAWWMDPVVLGAYPADGLALFERELPKFGGDDMRKIQQPLDFLGANIYSADLVRRGSNGEPEVVPVPPGFPRTAFDWPVTPEALHYAPRLLYERYQLPIVITENGLSCRDQLSLDGQVHDTARVDFITRHLLELARAIRAGTPVKGYFHWSILDNFEWAQGYKHRFGLIHVDYATQKRTPKASARHYRSIIATNAGCLRGL